MSPRERRDLPPVCDVTVVVTCYNHQSYVEQCLDSIAAQTRTPRQVIVIDDCSTDDSANVIEKWLEDNNSTFTFIRHHRNAGVCASMNEALALTESRYLFQSSGDDWQEPDRVERQYAAFIKHSDDTAILVGDLREVDGGGGTIVNHDFGLRLGHMTGNVEQPELLTRLLSENVVPSPAVLMRTDAIRDIGGYDEALVFEDYDMWLRLATRYSIAYEPGIVVNYRILASSMLRNPSRRAALLASEADMISKHVGDTGEKDAVIGQRLVLIAGEILQLGARGPLRHVLVAAFKATPHRWIKRALRATYSPAGIAFIRRRYATKFGVAN